MSMTGVYASNPGKRQQAAQERAARLAEKAAKLAARLERLSR